MVLKTSADLNVHLIKYSEPGTRDQLYRGPLEQ